MEVYEQKCLQDEGEIAAFVEVVKAEGVKSYLEIGAKHGGSLWRVGRELPKGSRIVAVDLQNGTREWLESRVSLRRCCDALQLLGHDVRLIWGDSTSKAVIEAVRSLAPFDAVLIDANHTLPYIEKDWANYGTMGKIVAFHDIAWKRAPEWVGVRIDVPQFWDVLKQQYPHREFRLCPTGKNNGIGIVWREQAPAC